MNSKGKKKASVKKGLAYEKKVQRWLGRNVPGEWRFNQWLAYQLADKKERFASPDAFLPLESHVVLLEFKLTQNKDAVLQLDNLYGPLLEYLYQKPVQKVLVCKGLKQVPVCRVENFPEFCQNYRKGIWTWHFLGQ